ncbi:MAG: hypothetical protein EXS09_15750 [Gemmataceae bacterium]|nr:hypothetical protein [Gemmataceae bacterium]
MADEPPRFWPWSLVWACLFALAHTQAPEYFSNQHHYFLHGFAQANVGQLNEDWLANTKDPTPVYSWLVAKAYSSVGPFAFQIVYFVLLGVYFESMRQLIGALPGFPDRGPARVLFLTLFLTVHAAILRVLFVRLTGVDYAWYAQAGLAAQYLLGPGLQPSAFGVLLITSLAAFVNQRPLLASVLAASVCVLHATYLLPAGLMVFAYCVVLVREKQMRTALIGGAIALVIVAPTLVFSAQTFLGGDADQLREAQRIFSRIRIPHHTSFERWFDVVAGVQIGVMGVGLLLAQKTRLFLVLLIPAVAGLLLAIVQIRTDSDSLALLFPWRFSVLLMPISGAIILGKLANGLASLRAPRALVASCTLMAVALAISGIIVMTNGLGYYTNPDELPLLHHIRENKRPGEVYLIPAKFPTLKKESPASQSKTFAPPVRSGAVGIPVDLQRFRLSTEAPIYIDFKAPPYEASEILEWHRRLGNAEKWYANRNWDSNGFWIQVRSEGITHVVTTTDKKIEGVALGEPVYEDASYLVYRIR